MSTRQQCSNLPPYPICGSAPQDSMVALCQASFDTGLRNGNPVISKICQVACPAELVAATGIHRSDEKNKLFTCNNNYDPPGGSVTKTMDCSKSNLFTIISGKKLAVSFFFFKQQNHPMDGPRMWSGLLMQDTQPSCLAGETVTHE